MNDLEKLHELCKLRSTLEAFALNRWPENEARACVVEKLRAQLLALKACALQGDYEAFHAADLEFHRQAVEAASLPVLLRSWELVRVELEAWILGVKRSYWPNLMALYREHEWLLDAWTSLDRPTAEQATHQHLEAGWYRRLLAEGENADELGAVDRAVSFLATHFDRPIDVAWLATQVSFVSASHLGRLFRERLGVSPLRYLKQLRLERAAQSLRSGTEAVASVARGVGYRNVSHFIRDFRQSFSVTPRQYRLNHA
ncbi:MAG: AraC family transcriptional regulator [Verrucomicrobiota bacterium]|jgi:AraC-like DNA-binding protein